MLQLYHLPPHVPPTVSNSSCLFPRCQPLDARCCTGPLWFSRYCSVRLKMFSLFFVCVCLLCVICVKSIINLVQYSVADYVKGVPRLTYELGLTNKLHLQTHSQSGTRSCVGGTYCIGFPLLSKLIRHSVETNTFSKTVYFILCRGILCQDPSFLSSNYFGSKGFLNMSFLTKITRPLSC